MRRLLLPVVAAFVLVLGVGALAVAQDATPPGGMESEEDLCPEGMGTPSASPEADASLATPPAADEAASPSAEQECHVDIQDFAFSPAAIEIAVGTTVTWHNHDSAPHTATADDGSFDTGTLDQDASASHTFDQAGEFSYVCQIHPNMTGTVVVS